MDCCLDTDKPKITDTELMHDGVPRTRERGEDCQFLDTVRTMEAEKETF